MHSNLGNVHQQQGDAAQAVRDYDRATQLAPDAPVPYLNRAIAKETLGVAAADGGDTDGALALWRSAAADCDRAIELDPAEFAAWFDRGNIRMRLGDYAAALTDFTTAADLAPGLAGGTRDAHLGPCGHPAAACSLRAADDAGGAAAAPPRPHPAVWLACWSATNALTHHLALQATACARPRSCSSRTT